MKNINKLTIFTLLLLSMTTMMSNVAIVTALPHLKEHFTTVENIEFYARLMLTLPSLAVAILSPLLGHLIFRFGKKRSALIALFVFSISGSAGLYLETIESLLLSRALFGVCIATLMIVSTSLVGDYFKEEKRHKFMGYQTAFMSIGGLVFVIGGGFLSDLSWRYAFGIYLVGLLLLPLMFTQIKEVKQEEIQEQTVSFGRKIYFIYFLAFFYMLIFFILPTQIPFLLMNEFDASGTFAGTVISTAFLANAFGAMAFAKLKTRFRFSTIAVIALFIVGLGFTGVGMVDSVYLFFFTAPLLGFGGGIMMTNLTAWMLSQTSLEKRVKTSGYFTSALFWGQFASPLVFHGAVTALGVQQFFFTVGLFLFSVVFITVMLFIVQKKQI